MDIRQGKIQGRRWMILLMHTWLVLSLLLGVVSSHAQQRSNLKTQGKRTETASLSKPEIEPTGGPARLREQLVQARSEYKSSLEQLLSLYEADAKKAGERLPQMKELLAQGLVTRREVETAETAAARAQEKVAEAQVQLKSADVQIAEALIETEPEEAAPRVIPNPVPRAVRGLVMTTAYMRYGGARAWSLSGAGAIKQFFMRRFSRPLPIGAFGQSPLHDRWSYDHRNAMDVGLHPDSTEGRALMEYLRANGVPFTAFRFAVPGKATGPHIHVGLPSHKIISSWAMASR